ncbi:MAG: nucleoside monophosphate kinase [Candidatus Taylorbacteria bacterium]|nr:nucleoside monophosphate kinase [Candidatus Taylorbacteria bacterium]
MLNIFKKDNAEKPNPMAFIFIGRSGCGKGTQVELFKKVIENKFGSNILHIETGSFFREFLKNNNSYTRDLSKQIIETGGLMPSAMPVVFWVDYLIKNFAGKENLIFDGCPRKVAEAEMLDGMLKFYNIPNYKVIYINTSKKWCVDRLTARGRKDDTVEGIEKRMTWFEKDVMPCIDFFSKDNNCQIININGEQTIEEVHKEVIQKVLG